MSIGKLVIAACMAMAATKVSAQSQVQDSLHIPATVHFAPAVKLPARLTTNTIVPASFSASFINPGFFCRQEVKLDKKLPVPLRIRLGSMQYCNWLEQKPGYRGPQQ